MTTKHELEAAKAAQKQVEKVQAFFEKLGCNLGSGRTAPSLAHNDLYVIEWHQIAVTSPPRLRDGSTFLAAMPARLSNGEGGFLTTFASPEPVVKAEHEAAEAALKKAEEQQKLTESCQLVRDIEELQGRAVELLAAGRHDELAKIAEQLASWNKRLTDTRSQRDAAVSDARAKLDAARAKRDLLDRAKRRFLRVERAPWTTGNSFSNQLIAAHERTEIVHAVDSITTIDLTEWNIIDDGRPPLAFPTAWLEMLVPVEIPNILDWVGSRYDELDPESPASAGVGASELHRAFLEAHGLHASQCPLESFCATVGEAFARKRSNTGSRYMIQLKLTEAQKEANLRALFEAEKAAREREEFEAWKKARAAAAAAQ